jgi:hypothetical protein
MNHPRHNLLHAIAGRRYHQIASCLDDDIAHSDLMKDVFMEKLEGMLEWVDIMKYILWYPKFLHIIFHIRVTKR